MNSTASGLLKKQSNQLILIALIMFAGLLATYWNHFDNTFHFDDFHTIVNNPYVKSTENIPGFFTDYTKMQSTRPVVKTYRPLVTTMNAISYSLGDDYNPFYFHLTIFILFIIQLVLMFFLFRRILNISYPNRLNSFIALFAVGWYAFHTVTAETINYIIARSDSMSTLFVIMALWIWACFPSKRKYGLYLIPALLGLFTKEQSAMFAPILVFFILLFEYKMSIVDIFRKKKMNDLLGVFKKALPALIVVFVITYIIVFVVRVSKEPDYGHSSLQYAMTQPFVWLHYFVSFFFPYKLSADPDMHVFRSASDWRMWAGFLFFIAYLWVIIKTSMRREWRPISFGLIWFGFALLPTSSFFALGQIANDHRMFFPFVGLTLSVSWAIGLIVLKAKNKFRYSTSAKAITGILAILIISAHALGTNHRNEIWHSEESLWKDAVEKSPKNERALMNYGLTLMSKGEYKESRAMFLRAYKLNSNYDYLLVNLGILYNAMEKKDSSEFFFQRALRVSPKLHVTNYYYGKHLFQQNKVQQAKPYVQRALKTVPHYMPARHLMMNIYFQLEDWENLTAFARETLTFSKKDELAEFFLNRDKNQKDQIAALEQKLAKEPDADQYINLSLLYYRNQQFDKMIHACRKALELNPDMPTAYNNIGSAYIGKKQYHDAIKALQKALELKPEFQRAKNNLNFARKKIEAESVFEKDHSYNEWMNLSLKFYRENDYENCIRSCKKALQINPESAEAYNNICSAYNKLGEYEKAATACRKAVKLNPDMERARNNLKVAERNL